MAMPAVNWLFMLRPRSPIGGSSMPIGVVHSRGPRNAPSFYWLKDGIMRSPYLDELKRRGVVLEYQMRPGAASTAGKSQWSYRITAGPLFATHQQPLRRELALGLGVDQSFVSVKKHISHRDENGRR